MTNEEEKEFMRRFKDREGGGDGEKQGTDAPRTAVVTAGGMCENAVGGGRWGVGQREREEEGEGDKSGDKEINS